MIVPRVLIVDPDPAIRRVLCVAIDWVGLIPMDAEDGQQALVLFKRTGADLVISNMYMPNMSGFHLLSTIRRYCSDVKVVFIVNDGSYHHPMNSDISKPDGYLNKPFSASDLVEMCKRMIGNKIQIE